MPSKLIYDQNYDNNFNEENPNTYNEIPSYRMPTISSQLKIVEREFYRNRRNVTAPFAVGTSFVTHNVKLLKQETLKKLKLVLCSYKNESEINSSNINELRLLKYDIDCFRLESLKLKSILARRKKHFIKSSITSRYTQGRTSEQNYREWIASFEKRRNNKTLSVGGNGGKADHDLTALLRLQNQLETLFKSNKCDTTSDDKEEDSYQPQINAECEKPVGKVEQLFERLAANNDDRYPATKVKSAVTINCDNSCSSKYSHKKERRTRKKKCINQVYGAGGEIYKNEEEYGIAVSNLKDNLKLPNELPVLDLSPGFGNFQPPELSKKNFSPSIYSRRKKRRHVKYLSEEPRYSTIGDKNETLFEHRLSEDESCEGSTSTTVRQKKKHSHKKSTVNERSVSETTLN